ncbi:flagellar basal-body rod modification protein FlgD [Rhodovulum bhavnagarense]|uniref:Basal-body rod modification protein FlgD n=1 Tax=Rhodovulum bhavnagarense TaxID=992286 RepID=A0A4R2REF2_9RHOB|nr:flagellar hook capping FlgD N-terminal domain-containing protein [Rhodovulum bhavnagarense]TCP61203.1 flagellar basal-body rod modification protein FlgD [Rhodovulum bhavnagarense]
MDSTSIHSSGAAPVQAATGTSAADKAAISSDFETFLKMLTAQMQNQDPLNPMDSTDYAVQIATFSGVEQQVRTNQLLVEMSGALGATGLSAYAGWVGQEVRVAAPTLFDGAPVTVVPQIAAGADSAVLVVRDAAGAEVQRVQLGLDPAPLDWAGIGADGRALASGTYGFTTESYVDGVRIAETPAPSFARVIEVVAGEAGVSLRLAGGAEVAADSVGALRAPEAHPCQG